MVLKKKNIFRVFLEMESLVMSNVVARLTTNINRSEQYLKVQRNSQALFKVKYGSNLMMIILAERVTLFF